MTSSSRISYVTATRRSSISANVALMMLALLLPQQLVLMLAANPGSVTAASVTGSAVTGSQETAERADDIADDLAALKASRHRLTADILRQHPYLNGGKRRAHIFVGKRNPLADVEAAGYDADGVEYDDDGLTEAVAKRPRMFVGKRPAIMNEDDIADDVLADDWQRQDAIEKRPRMFVGKRKAPVFVGKRSVDAVLQRRAAP